MKTETHKSAASAAALPPVTALPPCGPSLEYDNEFMVLQARLQPAPEVQYGKFTGRREGPDWAEVQRQCQALLARSIDINLMVWLLRCRTRQAGAQGLADGLTLLVGTLESYPQHVHPQPDLDGALGRELRANALAALADPEGLVDDVREVWVDDGLTSRLALRDIERAWAVPRVPDALPVDQVAAQLRQLRAQGQPAVLALVAAAQQLDRLNLWIGQHLQGQVCELETLNRLLKPFQGESWAGHEAVGATAPVEPAAGGQAPAQAIQAVDAHVFSPVAPADPAGSHAVASRQAAQAHIARARDWFEAHEPSSPVGVLLRQAERLVGKRYAEVAAAIPAELLARWEEAGE